MKNIRKKNSTKTIISLYVISSIISCIFIYNYVYMDYDISYIENMKLTIGDTDVSIISILLSTFAGFIIDMTLSILLVILCYIINLIPVTVIRKKYIRKNTVIEQEEYESTRLVYIISTVVSIISILLLSKFRLHIGLIIIFIPIIMCYTYLVSLKQHLKE